MDFNILLIASKAHLKLAPSYFSSLSAVCEILGANSFLIPCFPTLCDVIVTLNRLKGMKYWKIEILVTGLEKVSNIFEINLFYYDSYH